MTLTCIKDKSRQLREILRSKDLRNSLEVVAADIKILKIPEVLEGLRERCDSICGKGQLTEIHQSAKMLARIDT